MIRKRTKQTVFYDLLVLAFIPILASFLSLGLNLNFFFSTLFFFFLPSVYLSIRTRNAILRSLLFAIPFSVVSVLLIDHMAVLDLSWYVPTTMFNFRIFNTVPIEDLFWGFSVT